MADMLEIADEDVKLLELFAGKQDMVHLEKRDDCAYLKFCEYQGNSGTEKRSTIYHSIRWNDFEDIKDIFTNGILRCLPTMKHLILI